MIWEKNNNNSIISEIDPRIKIIIAFLFSIIIAVSGSFTVLIAGFCMGVVLVLATRISIRDITQGLIPVNIMILFLWIFLPFTFEGQPLLQAGPFTIIKEGVVHSALMTLKSNAIMLVLITLVGSTSIITLGHALHELGISKKLVHLFFFTIRYIHSIYREYLSMVNALKVRGFYPKNNLHTYKTMSYLIGMLLVRSFDKALRVHNAMLCRGFNGNLYSLKEFSLNKTDIACFLFMISIIFTLGIFEWIV
jgi:cobalt/nickel transport system permease protein